MRILLKGGPFHDMVIDIADHHTAILIPEPGEIVPYKIEDEGPEYASVELKISKYIRSGLEGYFKDDTVYPIWIYDGRI